MYPTPQALFSKSIVMGWRKELLKQITLRRKMVTSSLALYALVISFRSLSKSSHNSEGKFCYSDIIARLISGAHAHRTRSTQQTHLALCAAEALAAVKS